MNGVTFNGKHSGNDFNLFMISKSIQSPAKKKIKVDMIGMNSCYDFSTVASGGEVVFEQREITVKFGIDGIDRNDLYSQYSQVLEWLVDVSQSQLIFDEISDYYYLGEVEAVASFEEMIMFGQLEVKFICEPFKTSLDFVDVDDNWDNFNFEEDIAQELLFDVVTTETVSIYNVGRLTVPTVNCSVAMSVIVGGVTYSLVAGDNIIYALKLQNGDNSIIINGTGEITFFFRKVSL